MSDLETQARAWRAANEAMAVYLTTLGMDTDEAYDTARNLMDLADDTTIELPHTKPEALA